MNEYETISCPDCKTFGQITYSKLCNSQYICMACGKRDFWNRLKDLKLIK